MGIAWDDSGVASVTIAGAPAEVYESEAGDLDYLAQSFGVCARFRGDIPLRPGENRIEVLAIDAEGNTARAAVVVEYTIPEKPQASEGSVYALIIGIDDYEDPDIPDLSCAENDAEGVYHLFTDPKYGIAEREHVKCLIGKAATKSGIEMAIYESLITTAVNPEDMVVFFYAGHGLKGKHPIKGADYYMVPVEARLENLFVTGIEKDNLQRLWSGIRARRKIFISDACHSGGFTGMRGVDLEGFETVGEGKIVFAAAKADQKSVEIPKLGHGIFTYCLIDGLKGKADQKPFGNEDGLVAVSELGNYLQREVASIAARQGGRQNPIIEVMEATEDIVLSRPGRKQPEASEERVAPTSAVEQFPDGDKGVDVDAMVTALTYFQEGIRLFQKGEYAQAILEYRRAVKVDPKLAEAHEGLGETYLMTDQPSKAVENAQKAVAINPNSERGYLALGQALLRMNGNSDEGVSAFQEVLRINPKNASALIGLGMIFQSVPDLPKAIEHFQSAVQIEDNVASRYHLGSGYLSAEQYEKAEEQFKHVTESEAGFVGSEENRRVLEAAHRGLGFIYKKRRVFEEAIAEYVSALRYDPDNADLVFELGDTYARAGRCKEALDVLEPELKAHPRNIKVRLSVGLVLVTLGRKEDGIVQLRAVEAANTDPYSEIARATLLKVRGY
ncbi:MAG: tetratricopeptide repeat protein [Candidatus Latescibacterota bacterium]